ncbi:MAG: septum formation inhibitor Maf [Ignavibacteriae bacterium]|nr:septum formation inhibitor Maf [Ignavibacteriota bacterium]
MRILKRLVLASRSPRRIALLKQIGLDFTVDPTDLPEDFDSQISPSENAMTLALQKAMNIAEKFQDAIVIGADTIVVLDNALLGKPTDESDALRMLRLLSGRTHTVVTGFALVDCASRRSMTACEETRVTFRTLPDAEISEYIAGGSPMDKAGAYGIQDDYGAVFVTRIEGCFYNVVGFPLSRFYVELNRFQSQ